MAYLEHTPSAPVAIDPQLEARERIELAAKSAKDVGELQRNIREQVDNLAYPNAAMVNSQMAAVHAETRELLEEKADALDDATSGYENVAIDDLPPNIGGMNFVGGPQEDAVVERTLANDPAKMMEVLTHESDEEVGHASQALPNIPRGTEQTPALIIEGQRLGVTAVLEGDVERGVANKLGYQRNDRPEKDYAEGLRGAEATIAAVGEQQWKNVLKKNGTEAGNYGKLQQAIWQEQLATSSNVATVLQIAEEAEETGYEEEASEVILPFIQRQSGEALMKKAS